MGGFVLQRDDGKFLTWPGEDQSYSDKLQLARVYETREAAERDRCPGNETVRNILDLFHGPRPLFT